MGGTVKSTPEAKAAIQKIKSLIDGGLTDQITQLDNEGQKLSEPNNWDGNLAKTFRSETWPETNKALKKAKDDLDKLHQELDKIYQNIMQAGGNG